MTSSRRRVAQKPPRVGLSLRQFPAVTSTNRMIFRAKQLGREAWWYSGNLFGRLDLPAPLGTCYWADDQATATRERLGERVADTGAVTIAAAQAFEVARGRLPRNRDFAEVSSAAAAKYGVTRELVTMVDYEVPQAWARLFNQTGLGGVRYASRFTTGGANSWAIFGNAGLDTSRKETTPINGVDACAAAGIRVLPTPGPASTYSVIEPPTH